MSRPIDIPPNERGIVRVFALSLTPAEAEALRDNVPAAENEPAPQTAILGARQINSEFTEVFPVSDLDELGLAGYLIEGNDIDPAAIDPDRARLKALDGWVMLVFSAAFGGLAQTLEPAPEVTLIGTYAEPGVDWTDQRPLDSDSARGTAAPVRKTPSDAAMSGRIAMAALLVIFALTALVVWVAS